jgi:hypothetical protein
MQLEDYNSAAYRAETSDIHIKCTKTDLVGLHELLTVVLESGSRVEEFRAP